MKSTQGDDIKKRIIEIEEQMGKPDFWSDKNQAQALIKELQDLKDDLAGVGKYDRGDAIMTIFSGAGGDDAEDFSHLLLEMYLKYLATKNFSYTMLHQNQNDHGGYRNVTIEISGPASANLPAGKAGASAGKQGAYGTLKNESGVHRLVRISPFNASKKRHTSFSMVEVIPKLAELTDFELDEKELKVELSRSSGPGGQNVNKRETAVRIVHLPTNLSAHVDSQRSQAQNKEKALQILKGKLYKQLEAERLAKEKGMQISKTTQIEWGNQIRSYVLHPYKLVKDHRTGLEVRDVEAVLNGEIQVFIDSERDL